MKKPYFRPLSDAPPPLRAAAKRTIRFQEVDMLTIAWHGHYTSFFEDARVELGKRYGIGYMDFYNNGILAPVKTAHVDFIRPLKFGDEITIEGIFHYSEAARLNSEYLIKTAEGKLAATGYIIQMMLNTSYELFLTQPEFLKKILRPVEGRPAEMTPVYITDANVVTALGSGLECLFQGIVTGKQGLTQVSRFDTTPYVSAHAGMISDLVPQDSPEGSAILTLARRLLKDTGPLDPGGLLITASTKGPIDLIRNGMGSPVSGLPGQLARELGLDRSGFNINAACASSTVALAKGADLIRRGREHTVIIIALDMITEFVFSGFSAIGAMSPLPAMPFDRDRQGLTLGEGAAFLVLMSHKKCQETNRRALGEIKGWGIAGDAAHLTAPDKTGSGLKRAILQACTSAKTSPDSIHIINAHGTGTLYNDAMEIRVSQDLFDPETTMAHSIKGSIGHTLGAAGAIEAALCTTLLDKKVLPGTLGLNHPAEGAQVMFSSENREFATGPILTTNSGFGGVNAALIIGDPQ